MPRKASEENMTEEPTKEETPKVPIITEASALVRTIHANAARGLRVFDFDELTIGDDLISRLPKTIGDVEVSYVQWGIDNYRTSQMRDIAVPLTLAVCPDLDHGLLNTEGFVQNGDLIVLVMAKKTRDNWKRKKREKTDQTVKAFETESVRRARGGIVPELGMPIEGEVRERLKNTKDIYASK